MLKLIQHDDRGDIMIRCKLFTFFLINMLAGLYAQPVDRFMVFSDPHYYSPNSGFRETILFELVNAAITEEVDFIFITGDLIIQGVSEDSHIDSVLADWRFILDTLAQHDIRLYALRGNNDVSSGAAWDSLFSGVYAFPQNGPPGELNRTYAIVYDNMLFLSLDQYISAHRINQTWVDSILTVNHRPHIFAAGHEPVFKLIHSLGVDPEVRDLFWESLTDAGAKIFFCGHDHCYDHAVIDDGDADPTNDIHQMIVGTGGAYPHGDGEYDGDNGRWTPVRSFHAADTGYVLAEVTESGLLVSRKKREGPNNYSDGGDAYSFLTSLTEEYYSVKDFNLYQNYPNPFNQNTVISWYLTVSSHVELTVYNVLGEKVATLLSKRMNPGNYTYQFDGEFLTSGIYYCRFSAGEYQAAKKMILLR